MITAKFLKQSSPFNVGEVAGITEAAFVDLQSKGVVERFSRASSSPAAVEPVADVEQVQVEPDVSEPAVVEPAPVKSRRRGRRRSTPSSE